MKRNDIKKVLFILCGFAMTPAHAGVLRSFNEIYKSIQSGNNIRMVINFDNCKPKPPISNLSIFTEAHSVLLRNSYLQFANSPLTTNNPGYPGKPVLENCTYRISDNNELSIVTRIITLPTYSVVAEITSICPLDSAVTVFN